MKTYGYCRISTRQQSIERQIRNIKAEYENAIIITEVYTGTKQDRPEWNKLINQIKKAYKRSGNIEYTIVFDSVSRMSRNAEEGFSLYKELYEMGVELVFLKEPHINTSIYKKALESHIELTGTNVDLILNGVKEYLMVLAEEQIKLAFQQAEKEVSDLHQRTKEGIETARLNGKQIGLKKGTKLTTKKSIAAKKLIQKHCKEFNGTLSDVECMKLIGLAKNTFYKYKRELKEELMTL